MPPRAEDYVSSHDVPARDDSSFCCTNKKMYTRRVRPRPKLRFGVHGWSGVTSTALTSAALLAQSTGSAALSSSTTAALFSLSAAAAAAVTASSGVPLVNQAPVCTVIAKDVVPPHRDAFRRTASSVYYLCFRIVWNHVRPYFREPLNDWSTSVVDWTWGFAALVYALQNFLPRSEAIEWWNGNTYVFVLPMATGIIADALFQLPLFQCQVYKSEKYCWNDNVVTEREVLSILLSALVVAFVFTLAFRGSLGIRTCYWGSALGVHAIIWFLVLKAIPFVLNMMPF
mmetsp:Transcript_60463/g.148353  ORF Transcript_60463/g.148353 Transcript_60463/m.148353 type:complete len:285 (-) Transcript_60463:89-943(-)|eukprot:CAMPEP_0113464780 /NCGR_PEP_ID=MMETSP0014_2-20120614/13381_1 /TAXON_ID=2857 /ORGANISM="Nitzschia sp." /LENGTH=284 /DNA_ID=CAMNT_0000356879 /DNA_START=591 /DNA_END=1445 /DNA_ORIENTATION=- /assembly_acc=CAM_ASM_000159